MRLYFRVRAISAIAGLNLGPIGPEHFLISSQPRMKSLSRRLRPFPLSAHGGNKVALPLSLCAIHTRSPPVASDLALPAAYARVALEVAAGLLWQVHRIIHHRLFNRRDVAQKFVLLPQSRIPYFFLPLLGVKGLVKSPK